MNKIEVLRKIIDECDVTLKEAFIRRMDAANEIAEYKIKEGLKIYDPNREKFVLNNSTSGLGRDMSIYTATLWKAILRMSRAKQYKNYLEKGETAQLLSQINIACDMPLGDFCCSSAIPAFNTSQYPFLGSPIPVQSDDDVLRMVAEDEVTYGVIKIKNSFDTETLYTKLLGKGLYINTFVPLESGFVLAFFSKQLVVSNENSIISISYSIPGRHGELANSLSVLSDRRLNVEFIRLNCDETGTTNQVFVDFTGNINEINTQTALMQMSDEVQNFVIIGARKPLQW